MKLLYGPIWLLGPLEKTGKKEIALKSTGHEKVRVSVCLAAQANGKKLKPYIFINNKMYIQNVNNKMYTQNVYTEYK